jgi:hypothetical protein
MTVNITISDTSGGDSLADTVDQGIVTPGNDSDIQDLFIRHDAQVNPITDCAFYLQRYVGSSYLGDNADDDFTEVMSWGDAATGGFMINQVIPGGWTEGRPFWDSNPPYSDAPPDTWQVFKNGYGDINNQLILDEDSISVGTPAGDGVVPLAGEAHVQVKWNVPASVPAGAGYRAVTLVMAYSATS